MPSHPLNQPHHLATTIKFSQSAIVVFLSICFAWICFKSVNAIPSVDDFCYGARAVKEGVLQSVASEYLGWSGRYSATFFMSAFGGSRLFLTAYFVVPFSILMINFLASCHFINKFFVSDKIYKFIFFISIISVFSFREAVFWMSGGYTYGIAAAIFLFLIAEELGIYFDFIAKRPPPSLTKVTMLCVATLFLAGFNEVVMVAHITLLAQIFLFIAIKKQKSFALYTIGAMLIFAIVGALIVATAPGIAVRVATVAAPDLLRSVIKSFGWVFERYTHIFLISWLLFFSSLIVFSPQKRVAFGKTEFFATTVGLFFSLWAAIFARAYAYDGSGPPRTHTIDILIVSVLAFAAAWYVYESNGESVFQSRKLKPIFLSFVGIFITLLILRPGADGISFSETLTSLKYSNSLKDFMVSRVNQARLGKNTSLEVPDFPEKARSVTFFDDIRQDVNDWRNVCFAKYFELNNVRLQKLH